MNYRNPHYSKDGLVDCEIEHPEYGWIPFTASLDDSESYGRQLYYDIMRNPQSIAPAIEPTIEEMINSNRALRNYLLVELDDIVKNPLRWASFSSDKQAEYATYRQLLLDVPQQKGFPEDIRWPIKPTRR